MNADHRDRVCELLESLRDDRLSVDEHQELERVVLESQEARQLFVRTSFLYASLLWASERSHHAPRDVHRRLRDTQFDDHIGSAPKISPSLLSNSRRFLATPLVRSILIVALLVYGAFGLLVWQMSQYKPAFVFAPKQAVATVNAATDVKWSSIASPKFKDSLIRIGEALKIEAGAVEFELNAGTKLVVKGPADWTVDGANHVSLRAGKLIARVPTQAIGFTIETPSAKIVDLGTEFAVAVDESGVDVHVIQGRVKVNRGADKPAVASGNPMEVILSASDSARFGDHLPTQTRTAIGDFQALRNAIVSKKIPRSADRPRYVLLGNLFDDPHGTSLVDAMRTDTLAAVIETEDLGVKTVIYGGGAVQQIAPGIDFDLHNLGWQDLYRYRATNDSFDDAEPVPLQSRGMRLTAGSAKFEEGIGVHANTLVTFDLDEIRTAGGLDDVALEFICDRAGITDHIFGNKESSVHLAVLLSTRDGVQAAMVDGEAAELLEQDGVWSITSPLGDAIHADGRFVNFRVAIPVEAKWLTLVTTSAGDNHGMDGAVWSGARLNVKPTAAASQAATERAD